MAWAPAYATADELAAHLRIEDEIPTLELELDIEAASRSADRATGRQFGLVDAAEERTYVARWNGTDGLWEAEIDDLMTTTDLVVTVDGSAVSASNYEKWPLNAAQKSRPWEIIRLEDATQAALGSGPYTIKVTAWWGWCDPDNSDAAAVPDTVKKGVLLQAARLNQRKQAPFGIAGSPELGSELRLLDKIDADMQVILRDYWSKAKARGFA